MFLSGGFEAPKETVFTMQEVVQGKGGWSIPPEHMNSVNDMANAALYLATAEHVSGVVMTVDNTNSIWRRRKNCHQDENLVAEKLLLFLVST